ncbi:hypothetical protein GRAQ_04918 [Rahnella aquatilis CIP 78.65 = ATCC 33071]|uniref:Uncharacterized protein n=1 Tax=Rahnella aquatilis (strain ATCC 33071 / DSM 4594 / JCM 1683 / NBRC 105701 / NCIMB 13365 / CIP 78.65) TaxID=745277 RepID=H2J2J7_RAHAC|nr:hypothetical protein Rahaq2_4996 [Rahnella aquatilis CIP 78.65 = ATCC 33071]KFC99541.1 hypothetical protein GRAQ_04918 [Rahnella aquatilis CIP 78.65 = ATCC 33071]
MGNNFLFNLITPSRNPAPFFSKQGLNPTITEVHEVFFVHNIFLFMIREQTSGVNK